jgi:hypothetical protein
MLARLDLLIVIGWSGNMQAASRIEEPLLSIKQFVWWSLYIICGFVRPIEVVHCLMDKPVVCFIVLIVVIGRLQCSSVSTVRFRVHLTSDNPCMQGWL